MALRGSCLMAMVGIPSGPGAFSLECALLGSPPDPLRHNGASLFYQAMDTPELELLLSGGKGRSGLDLIICPRSKAVPLGQLRYFPTSIMGRTVTGAAIWRP
ncbi:hypothetical protein EVAR_70836_1 [Eumeta japonica]|uniref:Uncharacterized protein n=1 Tax=Eumeta variegata TaxID=151549 RepID=A0A4C2A7S2_EUMVA|nr:hypothetical protein EVAR_70836_1 [Eumeta japonica]